MPHSAESAVEVAAFSFRVLVLRDVRRKIIRPSGRIRKAESQRFFIFHKSLNFHIFVEY